MASDGLFDNCFDHEIQSIIKSKGKVSGELSVSTQKLAEIIAKKAEKHGADKEWNSPFSIAFEEQSKLKWGKKGGKQDDTSVIVSQIRLSPEEANV
jgi:serine/threonine protein phosphatase PrpC